MERIIELFSAIAQSNTVTQCFIALSILIISLLTAFFFSRKFIYGIIIYISLQLVLAGVLSVLMQYSLFTHSIAFILPSLLITGIVMPMFPGVKSSNINDVFDVILTAGKTEFVLNILRGAVIFGAAGSGKTATCFAPIIRHMINKHISGIIYDHKDFELAEVVHYFRRKMQYLYDSGEIDQPPLPLYTIAFHDPQRSNRGNPIAPRYIPKQSDLQVITSGLISNLSSEAGGDSIFVNGAKAAMNGVIWRLKVDFPDKCHWPMAAGILLQRDTEELFSFIEQNRDARLLASAFFEARDNERLLSSFKNSIADILTNIISPETFYILSGDDFDFGINKKIDPSQVLLVNKPGKEDFFNPLHSMMFESLKTQMCVRKRNPSLALLDEAGQIKLRKLYNIPALLRSFGIGTVFGIQDKVQGTLLYKENELYSLLANLSTKMFGKSNLPDTSKFYEKYFELVKRKQTSVSRKKTGLFSTASTDKTESVSEKEEAKHRAYEFERLKKGEFHVFDENGTHDFKRWDLIEDPKTTYECTDIPAINNITDTELEEHYNQILDEALELI